MALSQTGKMDTKSDTQIRCEAKIGAVPLGIRATETRHRKGRVCEVARDEREAGVETQPVESHFSGTHYIKKVAVSAGMGAPVTAVGHIFVLYIRGRPSQREREDKNNESRALCRITLFCAAQIRMPRSQSLT